MILRIHKTILIFSHVLLCIQLNAQYPGLDAYFNRLSAKEKAMGSVCVSRNGLVIFQKSFGYASLEPSIKADSLTVYRIGSISKTLTAAIILQMVDEGKLQLADKLSRFFPDWPQAKQTTIEHLLRHQSGIHNFGKDLSQKYRDVNPQSREEVETVFRTSSPDFKPGQRTEYNNANYIVLSIIAEDLDSKSFDEIVKTRIGNPIGLKHTYLGDSINLNKGEARPCFYRRGWNQKPRADYSELLGAGGIASTPRELCRFMEALMNLEFFSEETLQEMLSMEENMGLGIFSYPFRNKRCYGHAGNVDSFESMTAYFPDEKLAFAVCLNASRIDFNDLLIQLLNAFMNH